MNVYSLDNQDLKADVAPVKFPAHEEIYSTN